MSKESSGDKALVKRCRACEKKAQECVEQISKLLAKKGRKDEVVSALSKALATLKECKAAKSEALDRSARPQGPVRKMMQSLQQPMGWIAHANNSWTG